MRMVDLIQKKRQGLACTQTEIQEIVNGFTQGTIPDYQMSAWLMAVCIQGMSAVETSHLTMAMAYSGQVMDLSVIPGTKVDKHSTGGVGDKVSLIVAPIIAYLGIPVAKMSGRGLGHTGGTIDKLESIPGFQTEMTLEQFVQAVRQVNIAIVAQTGELAPADKKMYALRDVTATVESIPLIASSIMSKKIASGADAIVLDVKVGRGAFMKSIADARALATAMVDIGKNCDRQTIAIITDMQQPLGKEIGNANEIREAICVLQGKGEPDLTEVCLVIASYMAVLGGAFQHFAEAYVAIKDIIAKGEALETLRTFIQHQGGNPSIVDQPDLLLQAVYQVEVASIQSGYIAHIDAQRIGIAAMMLGAGRALKEDRIDHAVGITLHHKIGSWMEVNQSLCTLHANKLDLSEIMDVVISAYSFTQQQPPEVNVIHEVIL